jgi:hypothetical protein
MQAWAICSFIEGFRRPALLVLLIVAMRDAILDLVYSFNSLFSRVYGASRAGILEYDLEYSFVETCWLMDGEVDLDAEFARLVNKVQYAVRSAE